MQEDRSLLLLDEEDKAKPWDRLPEEPMMWYSRFCHYLKLPLPRSTLATYQKITKDRYGKRWKEQDKRRQKGKRAETHAPIDWYKAKIEYRWKERAEAFDLCLLRTELEQRQKEVEEEIKAELKDSLDLRKRGRELINLPLHLEEKENYREEDRPEGTITVHTVLVTPADPEHFRTGAQLLKEARTSARLALGLPTANHRQLIGDLSERELLEIKDRLNAYYRNQQTIRPTDRGTMGSRGSSQPDIIPEYTRDEDPDLNA